nr:hypothetical protein [Saprospiraceae bacterium]
MKNNVNLKIPIACIGLVLLFCLTILPTHFLRGQCAPEITVTIIQPSNHGCWDGRVIVDCASPSQWPGAWLIWSNGYQMGATVSDYSASSNTAYHYEWHGLPAGTYNGNVWGACGPSAAGTGFT